MGLDINFRVWTFIPQMDLENSWIENPTSRREWPRILGVCETKIVLVQKEMQFVEHIVDKRILPRISTQIRSNDSEIVADECIPSVEKRIQREDRDDGFGASDRFDEHSLHSKVVLEPTNCLEHV